MHVQTCTHCADTLDMKTNHYSEVTIPACILCCACPGLDKLLLVETLYG